MAPPKISYTVACASAFRDAVLVLAEKRGVNAADLARSVLLVVAPEQIEAFPDPGGPKVDDRETIILQSGAFSGRPWRRKPRLQLRLPCGLTQSTIRKALNIALSLDDKTKEATISDPGPLRISKTSPPPSPEEGDTLDSLGQARLTRLEDDAARLRSMIEVLLFEPVATGISSRAEALYVLGFPPSSAPDARELRARFRLLATIHHPDGVYGSHLRMSQINEAMDLLKHAR